MKSAPLPRRDSFIDKHVKHDFYSRHNIESRYRALLAGWAREQSEGDAYWTTTDRKKGRR